MDANETTKTRNLLTDHQNDWYFGAITRNDAENILIRNGLSEGLFLVRESVSSQGDYVLSCVQNGSIVHYQIRRIGDDSFFSIDSENIIHGLDMLLKHYRELSDTNDAVIVLKKHCRFEAPPQNIRLQGRTNLLHRAVAYADRRLVFELLSACDSSFLDTRNDRGMTAMHLAVELDEDLHCKILHQLIKSGANVNCRDSESITPLQYCAKHNKPKFANLLLVEGKAQTFCPTIDKRWVALHFAAFFGNLRVVEVLLENGAAPHPRDLQNKTPSDMVESVNHLKCKKLCNFYADRPLDNFLPRNQWFFEHLKSRYETNALFEKSGMKSGSFLVRKSRHKQNSYILAMVCDSRVYNFEIKFNNKFYFIDSGPYWPSLEHIISYYMNNSDGLPSTLSTPISSLIDMSENKSKNENDFDCSDKSVSNENIKSILFIDNNELKIGNMIGKGEYGVVFKGIWKRVNRETALVAIKILNKQNVQMRQQTDNFLSEVEVMTSLKHPHIIKLLGVCIGPPLMMVQEMAPMGSVLEFLIDHPNEVDISHDIKLWSTQIAIGMAYLESKHFVHRDLAARNVLLVALNHIKISDFGLSRALKKDQDSYEASNKGRWPLKWYAPESINFGTFTHSSDVWSYGVVLWEMYSFGEQPYIDVESSQIIKYLEDGKRLSKPINCSDIVFALISLCWSHEPKNRPTFHEIVDILFTNDSSYESIGNQLKYTIEM